MKEKKYCWHKVADSFDDLHFLPNGMLQVEVAGKTVCIVLSNGILLACAKKCPHAGGVMAEGFLDAVGNVVCPLHRYKFSLKNGCNVSGEGYFLTTFPVELRNEGVFIGFEENNPFNWLK